MTPANDPLATHSASQYEGGIHLRRLRESPFDTLQRLHDQLGHRPPTSLAEARAAAMLDGRLRRAGLQVIADTFESVRPPGWAGIIQGVIAFTALVAYYWFPWVTLGLIALLIVLACVLHMRPTLLAGKPQPSQNVIGNRAATEQRQYRLILLAALDTPWQHPQLVRVLGGQLIPTLRLLAIMLMACIALAGTFNPQRIWLYLLAIPCVYLITTGLLEALAFRPFWQAEAYCSAGLAVLFATCEELGTLEYVEVWAVGLGATGVQSGLADLLRRYPFDHDTTLFVALDTLGSGSPAVIQSEGWSSSLLADAALLATIQPIAEQPDSAASIIAIRSATLAQPLLAQHRAISIASLGPLPGRGHEIDPQHLDQATNLIVKLAQAMNQWKHSA
jgi:hypothetical protein